MDDTLIVADVLLGCSAARWQKMYQLRMLTDCQINIVPAISARQLAILLPIVLTVRYRRRLGEQPYRFIGGMLGILHGTCYLNAASACQSMRDSCQSMVLLAPLSWAVNMMLIGNPPPGGKEALIHLSSRCADRASGWGPHTQQPIGVRQQTMLLA